MHVDAFEASILVPVKDIMDHVKEVVHDKLGGYRCIQVLFLLATDALCKGSAGDSPIKSRLPVLVEIHLPLCSFTYTY